MTTYINLFGGPGIGKSSVAAGLYWYMKTSNDSRMQSVELINEYAKDRVWLNDLTTLKNQTYVSAKQNQRMLMVNGMVNYAITDSPLLIGLAYGDYPKSFEPYLLDLHNSFQNINIVLTRNIVYEHAGRIQTEEQAKEKDVFITRMLDAFNLPYTVFSGCGRGVYTLRELYVLIQKIQNK